MAIRVGWLPTGTQSAEDTRNAVAAAMGQNALRTVLPGYVPGVGGAVPFALTSTGSLSCSVGIGQAWVTPAANANQGPYPVTVDATGSGLPTVSFSAGGSLSRTDVIYIQVQDTAEDSSGFTRGQVSVVQGANGGGVPSVPSGALALWQVPVPASASSINFATATFVPAAAVSLGGVYPAASSAQPAAAYKGLVRARNDLGYTAQPGPLEAYDGSAWQSVVPASYPRGQVGATETSATASNSSNSTPIVDISKTVTLTLGRRYRVTAFGVAFGNQTSGQSISIALYWIAGSSIPSNASGATQMVVISFPTALGLPWYISEEFVPSSSGTYTVAEAYWLVSGTGVVLPTGVRKLFIEDIGI